MDNTFHPDVYITMTTFPSRISSILKMILMGLLKQDYTNIKGVFITIPMENMRGQPAPNVLPQWFNEEPIASRVTVLRPAKDAGPILKYIGAADLIPKDAWVFVCDDDQKYKHNYISKLVACAGKQTDTTIRNKTIYNSWFSFEHDMIFAGMRLISGYQGVLINKQFIECILANFHIELPLQCKRIDDDLVSLYARDNGFRVKSVPVGFDIFYFFGSQGNIKNSLFGTGKRTSDRHFTHKLLNTKYADNLAIAAVAGLFAVPFLLLVIGILIMLVAKKQTKSR
jgi:hypothetical protein